MKEENKNNVYNIEKQLIEEDNRNFNNLKNECIDIIEEVNKVFQTTDKLNYHTILSNVHCQDIRKSIKEIRNENKEYNDVKFACKFIFDHENYSILFFKRNPPITFFERLSTFYHEGKWYE